MDCTYYKCIFLPRMTKTIKLCSKNGHCNVRELKRALPPHKSLSQLNLQISLNKISKIQIDHQPDATIFQFIILTFIYSSTCLGRSPAHHQELNNCSSSLRFHLRIVVIAVLCSWSGRL